MTPDLEIRRGEEASRVLQAEVYKEAFAEIEQRLISQLAMVEIPPERAEYLRQLLVANRKIRGYLEQVMVTGKLAEQQQSLMDRMRGRKTVF